MSQDEQREIWDGLYKCGMTIRYPWTLVVSTFMARELFGNLTGKRVLEYGCGTATNMPFFADMGMRAFGFDFSETSIAQGARRLRAKGYDVTVARGSGDCFDQRFATVAEGSVVLGICDFQSFQTPLAFDYVLDRAALCCAPLDQMLTLVNYIHDVLVPGGLFVFTPYSDRDPSNPAHNWAKGHKPVPIGEFSVSYLSYNDVTALLARPRWSICRFREVSDIDPVSGDGYRHWLVVARKVASTTS